MPAETLGVAEVGVWLNLGHLTVQSLARHGLLPGIKTLGRRSWEWRFTPSELRNWVEQMERTCD